MRFMSNKILVTYATRGGTTADVAEAIAVTLIEHGGQVEVRPVQAVRTLEPYGAVIVGSAIQGKRWLPEAVQFVQTHRVELSHKPFAAFLVCLTLALNNEQWRTQANVADWLTPVRALVTPISEGYFAGVLDISTIPSISDRLKFRASVMSGVWSEGDHRDWEAIRAWAKDLAAKLASTTFQV